jgi:glycosidase
VLPRLSGELPFEAKLRSQPWTRLVYHPVVKNVTGRASARSKLRRVIGALPLLVGMGLGCVSKAPLGAQHVRDGASPGATSTAAAQDPGRTPDFIYFVLVDRFNDGDPGNNIAVDKSDPGAWHGGDLAGVTAKLDYLQGLGVRTLWLSPIFQTRTEPFDGHAAFHGYWVQDLRIIDPRFGGMPALTQLIEAAHARGMRVLLDMVVNHVGFGAPLIREHPDWFHPKGGIDDWNSQQQVEEREVHGLPDLAQEREPVFRYLTDAATEVITKAHPDGFRLDAVKHVPLSFWRRYTDFLRSTAGADFSTLGEMYDGSAAVLARVQEQGGFSNLFDFATGFAIRDTFCSGADLGAIGVVLTSDREYRDASQLVTFIDNHDMPRIVSLCAPADVERALSALFLLRGTPSLTYGTEAGLQGAGEPQNRGDMVFPPQGSPTLVAHIARLAELRRRHPVLANGRTRILSFADNMMALLRSDSRERVIEVFNNNPGERPAPLALPEGCHARELDKAAPSPLPLHVAGRNIGLWQLEGCDAAALEPPPHTRDVEFDVASAARAGMTPGLIGSGSELGRWNAADAVMLRPDTQAALLHLPEGGIFAYKLLWRDAQGKVTWEKGNNRYLFVTPGEGTLRVSVTARAD